MKIRKEYVVFGIVIIFMVCLILFSRHKDSKIKYDNSKVSISFNDSDSLNNYNELTDSNDIESDSDISLNNDDNNLDEIDSYDLNSDTQDINNKEDTSISIDEDTSINDDTIKNDDLLKSDSEIEPDISLDDDSVKIIVQYYVCNLNDEDGFAKLLTDNLVNDRQNRLDSEPYKSLNGITSLSSLEKNDDIVILKTVDNDVYKFKCYYTDDGNKISGIEYIND